MIPFWSPKYPSKVPNAAHAELLVLTVPLWLHPIILEASVEASQVAFFEVDDDSEVVWTPVTFKSCDVQVGAEKA